MRDQPILCRLLECGNLSTRHYL